MGMGIARIAKAVSEMEIDDHVFEGVYPSLSDIPVSDRVSPVHVAASRSNCSRAHVILFTSVPEALHVFIFCKTNALLGVS